jgi:hypothetical protein
MANFFIPDNSTLGRKLQIGLEIPRIPNLQNRPGNIKAISKTLIQRELADSCCDNYSQIVSALATRIQTVCSQSKTLGQLNSALGALGS